MNAGMFIESAAVGLPAISFVGSILSWAILAVWWTEASGSVGTLASLSVVAGLTLITLGGYGWSHRRMMADPSRARVMQRGRFSDGLFLGLTGHLFLFAIAANREWALPPWPLFGTLLTLTLAASVTSLAVSRAALHVAATIAAALVVLMWTLNAPGGWEIVGLVAAGAVSAYSLACLMPTRARGMDRTAAIGAAGALFISEVVAIASADASRPPFVPLVIAHVVTLSIVLALTWRYRWRYVAIVAAVFAWAAAFHWQMAHVDDRPWVQLLVLASAMYAVFIGYPLTLGKRAGHDRDPYVAAIAASAMLFFAARAAFDAGHLSWMVGIIPVTESAVLVVLVRALLRIEAPGERDLGRLALVAGAALAFVTVAIPLQLEKQWITIGWALEGAALAWLYRRIPHRGLLHTGVALLGAVFVRLALNPEVFLYEPRGAMRIFNWYLYTYLICAVAMLAAAWWFARTDDRIVEGIPGVSRILPGAAGVLLFLLLNIEIADFYATGPEIAFRFGADVSQDLTYTIGWLFFGMALLAVGIWRKEHAARVAAVMLIAITTVKCFLYDLSSLGGLYRVASFIGLAMSLSLVAVALQRFVLARPKGQA